MAALATRCLDFCQHLEAQGKAFKFSLSLGNDFTFTLDTREEATTSKVVRKKLSPSSLKRNARRKLEFQNRKANTSEKNSTTPEKESTTSENKAASSETKSTTSEAKSGSPEKAVKSKKAKKNKKVCISSLFTLKSCSGNDQALLETLSLRLTKMLFIKRQNKQHCCLPCLLRRSMWGRTEHEN